MSKNQNDLGSANRSPTTKDKETPALQIVTKTPEPAGAKSTLTFHPLAGIFPVPDNRHLTAMASDIAAQGLLDEIVLYEGKILDGRCRYFACERAGVTPRFRRYDGSDPLGFVISRNVRRRHLSNNQRTLAAARAATLPVGSNQAMRSPGLPIGKAAEVFEVSERNIARGKTILRHGAAELVQAVETGKIAISRAADLCGFAEQEQLTKLREIIDRKSRSREKPVRNESTIAGRTGGVRQSQSQSNEHRDFVIPRYTLGDDERSYADLFAAWSKAPKSREPRDNEKLYSDLLAAWFKASKLVRRRFIEEVIHEF